MEASVLCISTLFQIVLILYLADNTHSSSLQIRKPEKLFNNETIIHGLSVVCSNTVPGPGLYPSDTWTCYNMTVAGKRMRYLYHPPSLGSGSGCFRGEITDSNKDDRSLWSYNDIGAFCREMLYNHGISTPLWSVYMDDVSCSHSRVKRMLYNKHEGNFHWEEIKAGSGYAISIRCMVDKPVIY